MDLKIVERINKMPLVGYKVRLRAAQPDPIIIPAHAGKCGFWSLKLSSVRE